MSSERLVTGAKVLDGGLGTELVRNGQVALESDPLWSARILKEDPSAIKEIHKSFLKAGSNAIITSSYQASIDGFMEYCDVSREGARELIASSVDIAKDAVREVKMECNSSSQEYYVAASIGPYGACLHDGSEYTGNYVDNMSVDQLKDWHRERLSILMSREPDYLAMETMPSSKEATALAELLREHPNAKAWITFTCMDGQHISHGEVFRDAVKAILPYPQVVSVGLNCCHPEYVQSLLSSVEDLLTPEKTFVVYPNIGNDYIEGKWVAGQRAKPLSEYIHEWLQSSKVEWIGGCCGSQPSDIRQISEIVSQWNSGEKS